ncbi:MAG: archaeal heat shock protein Hsp20 [Methanomassiliicoccales archaeon]
MVRDKKKKDWDDFFGDFDDEFEEMRRRIERIMEKFFSGDLHFDREPMIYGFSMRIGPDGKPRIQEFGNTIRQREEAAKREPLTDIIEEADKVRIIVELPGVEKEDIKLNATEDSLEIEVDNPDRKFEKRIDLPCEVDPDSAKATYKNGVLEIHLKRARVKEKGKEIRIE